MICGFAVLVALSCLTAVVSADEPRTFNVRDFGAVPDGNEDAGGAIRAAISAATASGSGAVVALKAGAYRVKPAPGQTDCFPIVSAAGLTIRGAGPATRIVVTNPACGAFMFANGKDVALCDLTIDFDPLPFCQGTIRTVDVASGSSDLDVDEGYPMPDAPNFVHAQEPYGKWGMIIDRTTRRIRTGTPDHYMTPKWEHVDKRVYRFFTAAEHYRLGLRSMQVGDGYVHLARGYGGAVLAQFCEGIRIENVVVHASPGLAVGLVGNSKEAFVRGLKVVFPADGTRLLTTNANGVHCQQNRVGPVVEGCTFEGMADDAVNIYTPPNTLLEVRGPIEWVVTGGCRVLAGDRLQVFDPKAGLVRGEVRVRSVRPEAGKLALTLEAPFEGAAPGLDHRTGDTLYDLSTCGAGFRIAGNRVNGNRRYGCLLRAGDGVVEDNVFADMTGGGVVLTNEPGWPEGPVPWGITIRRNRFIRGGTCQGYADAPGGASLIVRGVRLASGLAEGRPVHGIVVEGNEFEDVSGTAMYFGAVDGLTARGNRIRAVAGSPPTAPLAIGE